MAKLKEKQKNLSPLQIGRQMLTKMVERAWVLPEPRDIDKENPEATFDETLAKAIVERKAAIAQKIRVLDTVYVRTVGNVTIAHVNNHVAWAKFNPNDKKTWTEKSKGKLVKKEASKFSEMAGKNLAIHRAIKLVFEQGA